MQHLRKILKPTVSSTSSSSSSTTTSSNMESNILISFFNGAGRDHQHRSLEEILQWPDELLERCHDYIQTLFPLPESSRFSWTSELIDEEVFNAFRATEKLRDNLRRAFDRILSFYGLESLVHDGKVVVRRADNFGSRSQNWVTRVDHNHLRITRIIRSLRILGLEEEAEAFFQALSDIYLTTNDRRRPSKDSMKYWTRAAKRPLNFAPDVNNTSNPHSGQEFLWKYEQAKAEAEAATATATAAKNSENKNTSLPSDVGNNSDSGVLLPKYDEDALISIENAARPFHAKNDTGMDANYPKTGPELMGENGNGKEIKSIQAQQQQDFTSRPITDAPRTLKRKVEGLDIEESKKAAKSVDTNAGFSAAEKN